MNQRTAIAAGQGSVTSSGHEEGSPPVVRHMVVGLPGYGGVHHEAKEDGPLHRDDRDRSCRGHRSDEVEVRPWHRKDLQGSARAVGHTHQGACDHEAANVHILHHVYHKTRAVECVGGSRRDEGCSLWEDHGDRSSHHMAQVGNRHHDGPLASGICICHDPCHLGHQGLHKEREA